MSPRNGIAVLIGAAGLMLAVSSLLFGPVITIVGSNLGNVILSTSAGVLPIALAGVLALKVE
jgi:hypothetical protein